MNELKKVPPLVWIMVAAAVALWYYSRPDKDKYQDVSDERAQEITGGKPTLSEVELNNLARSAHHAIVDNTNAGWIMIGNEDLYNEMVKLDNLSLPNLGGVIRAYKKIYGKEDLPNLGDALAAEYIPYFWGASETSTLRQNLVLKIKALGF